MSLTGKRVSQFTFEATSIGDNDFFGADQDIGAGVYQTKKFKGAVFGKRGNLLYVDKLFGSDTLGVRGRADRPFLTLTAAKTAALSGDTIIVRPGTYAEGTINKDGVNWHFLPGTTVNSIGLTQWVMNDSAFEGGTNVQFTSRVTGSGIFIGGFWTSKALTACYVEGFSITNGDRLAALVCDSGLLHVKARTVQLAGSGVPVNANGGTFIVEADTILSNDAGNPVVWIKNACNVKARLIQHINGFYAVENIATTGESVVESDLIIGGDAIDAVSFAATGGIHQIVNSKIRVPSGNNSAIGLTQSGLILRGVTLVGSGTGFSIDSGVARTIQAWSYILGNKVLNNVTITDDSAPSRFVQSASVA